MMINNYMYFYLGGYASWKEFIHKNRKTRKKLEKDQQLQKHTTMSRISSFLCTNQSLGNSENSRLDFNIIIKKNNWHFVVYKLNIIWIIRISDTLEVVGVNLNLCIFFVVDL